jgi:hypothetical protein
MKIKNLFPIIAILFAIRVQAAPIEKTMAALNADAQKPGGPERVMKSISASTHVPVATLEKGKAKYKLNYGDLFMAYSIASASGKTFDDIAARKAKGASWQKVADEVNVSLDGKKKVAKQDPGAKPAATPPQKTLRQIQNERYSGQNSGL